MLPTSVPVSIQLIVGLGNPGSEYAKTRHNVGFWFIDELASRESASLRHEPKFHGSIAKVTHLTHPCWLIKPNTYMNESGRTVVAVANFYKIPATSILVVHDELDFAPGTVRIKQGGGHGGHNGLRNIIDVLGTKDFYRIRLGIGHPGHKSMVMSYVLSEPTALDKDKINQSIDESLAVVSELVDGDVQKAFRFLHSD